MAVKLTLRDDGTIETIEAGSPQEARDAYLELLRNGSRPRKSRHAGVENGDPRTSGSSDDFPEPAKKLVHVLAASPQGMKTSDVSRTLGVAPRGVGGSIMSLTNWGKHHGFSKGQLITKERVADGHGKMVRKIKINEDFVKLVREGKIQGFVF
jgi:hypothetical protein